MDALVETDCSTAGDTVYEHRTRIADHDRHPSNHAAENMFDYIRGDGWRRLSIDCRAHKTVQSHQEATAEIKADVSSILNIALTMKTASYHVGFKECLRQSLEARIRFRQGVPDPAWELEHRIALRVFVTGDGAAVLRRVLLTLLPNGSWKETEFVDVWFLDLTVIDQPKMRKEIGLIVTREIFRVPKIFHGKFFL